MDMAIASGIHWTVRVLELLGITIIVLGAALALIGYLRRIAGRSEKLAAVDEFRSDLGRSILLGLEFLVAADIINTVAIEPTLDNLAVLAGIVLIRTFLSFALEVELEGRWPWQRAVGRKKA